MVTQGTSSSSISGRASRSAEEAFMAAYSPESARCHCGLRIRLASEMSDPENPGRRFLACPNMKLNSPVTQVSHHFFTWFDPPFPDQASRVIRELLQSNKALSECNANLVENGDSKDAEIEALDYDFNEAKGLAEMLSAMEKEHLTELEMARKENKALQWRLKVHNCLSGILAVVAAVLFYRSKDGK